jgi:hypothetical protein
MAATMNGPGAKDDAIAVAIAAAGALARAAGINAGIAATLDGADAGEVAMANLRAMSFSGAANPALEGARRHLHKS